jgi:competence protein ComEC
LLQNFHVSRLLAGEKLELPGQVQQPCSAAQQWNWDGVRFEFVHPLPGENREGNDGSCVLLVSSGARRALFTGDIGARVERNLVQRGIPRRLDLVSVPHHGSRTSSSPEFVSHVSATLAVVPSGYHNRWGFPRQDVAQRWAASGSRLLTTANSGAVSQRLCRDNTLSDAREARMRDRRYWHE